MPGVFGDRRRIWQVVPWHLLSTWVLRRVAGKICWELVFFLADFLKDNSLVTSEKNDMGPLKRKEVGEDFVD